MPARLTRMLLNSGQSGYQRAEKNLSLGSVLPSHISTVEKYVN